MPLEFLKMHGLGNDFIVIDERKETKVRNADKADFARKYCERRFSIGADGVLFLGKSKVVDTKMRIFNSDGSEAETCVNGLRCVALALFKVGNYSGKKNFDIDTPVGLVHAVVEPISPNLANVGIEVLGKRKYLGKDELCAIDRSFEYHSVNVGNPHVVIFLEEPLEDFEVEKYGHAIEYHKKFQHDRTNTEFVNFSSSNKLKMRVHERGACETKACGSGSLAVVIASCEAGYSKKNEWISVEQPGGVLHALYGDELKLKGPAEISFCGRLEF